MSGLEFLVWLEHLRSAITDALFIASSALGSEEAYTVVLATVYLCFGHRFGFHLFVMFSLSAFLNAQLKWAFQTARPFEMFPEQLHPLCVEGARGPAFPSGHAQNAAVVWGIMAIRAGGRLGRAAALALVGLIAFSRLYCQVHWPADVLGGLLIGGALVLAYLLALGVWRTGERRLSLPAGAWLIIGVSALMCLSGWRLDACVRAAGATLGVGLGFILLEARGGYKAHAPLLTQGVKMLVALPALFGVRVGMGKLLGGAPWAIVACYAAVGFTCAYLLPMLFAGFQKWRLRAEQALDDVPG